MMDGLLRNAQFHNMIRDVVYSHSPIFPSQGDCQDLVAWYADYVLGYGDRFGRLNSIDTMVQLSLTAGRLEMFPSEESKANDVFLVLDDNTSIEFMLGRPRLRVPYAMWLGKGGSDNPSKRHMFLALPTAAGGKFPEANHYFAMDLTGGGLKTGLLSERIRVHRSSLAAAFSGSWDKISSGGVVSAMNSFHCVVSAVPLFPIRWVERL